MAIETFVVNIDNGYSTGVSGTTWTGYGDQYNPFDYNQFAHHIALYQTSNAKEYLLSGSCVNPSVSSMDFAVFAHGLNINYYRAPTGYPYAEPSTFPYPDVIIRSYDINNPSKITETDYGYDIGMYNCKKLLFEDVMIDNNNAPPPVICNARPTNPCSIYFNNCWVKADYINSFRKFSNIEILNSTFNVPGAYFTCFAYLDGVTTTNIKVMNSILNIQGFNGMPGFTNVYADNSVFTCTSAALSGSSVYKQCAITYNVGNQFSYSFPTSFTSAVSAITSATSDYLSSEASGISAVGNPNAYGGFQVIPATNSSMITKNAVYNYPRRAFYGMSRDGVGALAFTPIPSYSVTATNPDKIEVGQTVGLANGVSAYQPSSVGINYANRLGSGSITSAYNTSFDFNFTTYGSLTVNNFVKSKNGWNSVIATNTLTYDVSYGPIIFSTIIKKNGIPVYEADTFEELTFDIIAYNNTDDMISAVYWDFGDGLVSSASIPSKSYYVHGEYNPVAYIVVKDGDVYKSVSPTLTINEKKTFEYYVDLDSSYTTSGTGNEISPFCYEQLYTIVHGRLSEDGTTFYLKGYREIDDHPIVTNKKYIFDAWDLVTYGPWMLILNESTMQSTTVGQRSRAGHGYLVPLTYSISLRGGTVCKNGIIYNKPKPYGTGYVGLKMILGDLFNMYVINNGTDGEIQFVSHEYGDTLVEWDGAKAYRKVINTKGSTIYTDGKIRFLAFTSDKY